MLTFHFNSQTSHQVLKNEFWNAFKPRSRRICSWNSFCRTEVVWQLRLCLFPQRLLLHLPSFLPFGWHLCCPVRRPRAINIFSSVCAELLVSWPFQHFFICFLMSYCVLFLIMERRVKHQWSKTYIVPVRIWFVVLFEALSARTTYFTFHWQLCKEI